MPIFTKPGSRFFYYDFRFNGRRYRGSTRQTARKPAQLFEDALHLRLRSGDRPQALGRGMTLREYLPKFTAFFDNHQQREAKTKQYYRSGAKLLLETSLANRRIDQITTSMVANVAFGLSPYTANSALRTLRRALSQAVEWELLGTAPRIHLHKEAGRTATFTPEYEARFLEKAAQPLRDVFLILMDQGMRPDEVYRMRWEHVLWERSSIFVPRGKTAASERYIGMSSRVQDCLKARVVDDPKSIWVFPAKSESGHIVNVSKAFRQAREDANLPKSLVLYSCRHTFGTDFMQETGNPKELSVIIGHTDTKMSARYQHPSTNRAADVMNRRNQRRLNEKSATILESGHTFGHRSDLVQ
jgi:integrase